MNVTLYTTADDLNVVNKRLNTVRTVDAHITGNVSVLNPTIIFSLPQGLGNFNYAKIDGAPFNGRYYFINDIQANGNHLVTLNLSVDVLKTYADGIKAEKAVLRRQENIANAYITDPESMLLSYDEIGAKKFPFGFTHHTKNILIMAGVNA